MRQSVLTVRSVLGLAALIIVASFTTETVLAAACTAPDNGPARSTCQPIAVTLRKLDKMHIINGLPVGTTIDIDPVLFGFSGVVRTPGARSAGRRFQFNASCEW